MLTENQQRCLRCYGDYKNGSFTFMFDECPLYKEKVGAGILEQGKLCPEFKGILADVKNAQAGRKLDDGITYPQILEEMARSRLEKIPEGAYRELSCSD